MACAAEAGEIGLLLHDLTSAPLPNTRTPLSGEQEGALLDALARLHALFWDAGGLALDWLVRPAQYCDLLASSVAVEPAALAVLTPPLHADVPRGWAAALARLPQAGARQSTQPGIDWEGSWADLPRTLLHGEAKVANFAVLPGEQVAAFEWALVGTGPCTIDLGWYLAVNASRLTGPKEQVISHYRTRLEAALGNSLPDSVWQRLETVAIVCGARMLLWSKVLALEVGRPGSSGTGEWSAWLIYP